MRYSSRRDFLQASAAVLAAIALRNSLGLNEKPLKLAYSTLGCPDWSFSQIIDFAKLHGYSAIEVRGIQKQMDLTKCKEFNSEKSRKETLTMMKDKGLQFINLGSSANMHLTDATESKKNLDEARSFIDLAKEIKCPYVRVFPNKISKDQKEATIEMIAQRLNQLGEYAKDKNVTVLMETHGEAVWADDILKIMELAGHDHIGLVWDICNMWTVTKEPPADVYKKLSKYIYHTHIKDAKLENNVPNYVLLGKGDVPIFEAIDLLAKNNYKGYYSFEWEKMWHPEIAEPEVALADYAAAMNKHFRL